MQYKAVDLDNVKFGKSTEEQKTRYEQINEDRLNANFKRLEDSLQTLLVMIQSSADLNDLKNRVATLETNIVPKQGGTYEGDVYGGGLVRSVNTVAPDENGDVTIAVGEGTVKSVNGNLPDEDTGDVSIDADDVGAVPSTGGTFSGAVTFSSGATMFGHAMSLGLLYKGLAKDVSTDLDNLVDSGIYHLDGDTLTNAPSAYTNSYLLVFKNDTNDTITQTLIRNASGVQYICTRTGSGSPITWGAWDSSLTPRYVGSLSTGGNVSFADANEYTFYAARNSTGYRWFGIHPNGSTSIYMFGYYNTSSYMYTVMVALTISAGKISEPSSTSTYRNTTYQSANNVDIGSLYAIC